MTPAVFNIIIRGSLDADARAYCATTGATDKQAISRYVKGVKSLGLWANLATYLCKPTQNYDAIASLAALSGLTSNAMTLSNGPTRGASGVSFDGVSQCGFITDFTNGGSIAFFLRTASSNVTDGRFFASQYDSGANERSVLINNTSGKYRLNRSSDGTASFVEGYGSAENINTGENTLCALWTAGGGRSLRVNRVAQTLSLTTGSAVTNRHNNDQTINLAATKVSGSFAQFGQMTATAFAVCNVALTADQQDAVTDLLNAL